MIKLKKKYDIKKGKIKEVTSWCKTNGEIIEKIEGKESITIIFKVLNGVQFD